MAMLAVGGTQLVAVTSADAAITIIYSVEKMSLNTSEVHKEVFAKCFYPDDLLVGSGAKITAGIVLTGIQPERGPGLLPAGVRAFAENPPGSGIGETDRWVVIAYAICARPGGVVRDVEVVKAATEPSVQRFQHTAARCPDGKRAVGSGAAVQTSDGAVGDGNRQLGLQLNRTSGPMDISRAAAAAFPATPAPWSLVSYAICARPIPGAAVHGTLRPVGGVFSCPANTRVFSVGGGGPLRYPGQSFLHILEPSADLQSFHVQMRDRAPVEPPLQVAIGAVCAPG